MAKIAGSRIETSGPAPARFAMSQLQRVVLRGASYFGMATLEQLDDWMVVQMQQADRLMARVEKAIIGLRNEPKIQQILLKIPRWLPLSRVVHENVLARTPPSKHCKMPSRAGNPANVQHMSKTVQLRTPTRQHPTCNDSRTMFSRRALVTLNPSALPARVWDEETLTQLQHSPLAAPSAFSRRAQAASKFSIPRNQFLDDEELTRLASEELLSPKKNATPAKNVPDMLSAFNPVMPTVDVGEFLNSVGTLFDTNPTHAFSLARSD